MICSNCKMRWADFPKDEFLLLPNMGIVPKHLNSAVKRELEFESDEVCLCPACKNELDELPAPREYLYRAIT